ncbi:MAG: transposase [Burkholderiaceae bacterium]|nr:transposase [Burkholderiaceae bacterium]
MSKVRPPYPAEFRQQMVELVRAGRAPAQLSREFGVTRPIHHQLGRPGCH